MPIAKLGAISKSTTSAPARGHRCSSSPAPAATCGPSPTCSTAPLAKAFDVVCYDQRGLGRTEKPGRRPTAWRTTRTHAAWADGRARLAGSAKVVGASFGGMVAQELALRHPDKVERLALACTSPGGAGGASYPFHEIPAPEG